MRKSILEKEKKKSGCGWFMIILILLGFIVSVFLFGKGQFNEIIHP